MVLLQRKRGFGHKYKKAITGMGKRCQKAAYHCTECHGLSGWVRTISAVGEPDLLSLPWRVRGPAGGQQAPCSVRDTHIFLLRRRDIYGHGAGLQFMARHFIALTASKGGLPSLPALPRLWQRGRGLHLAAPSWSAARAWAGHPWVHTLSETPRSQASLYLLSKEQTLPPLPVVFHPARA